MDRSEQLEGKGGSSRGGEVVESLNLVVAGEEESLEQLTCI